MEDFTREVARAAKIRLRFDKVVQRVAADLRAALADEVPKTLSVVVAMTAPIKLPSKTEAELETTIQALLGRRSHKEDWKGDILGNRVRIRVLTCRAGFGKRVLLLVHNDESDAGKLLDAARVTVAA